KGKVVIVAGFQGISPDKEITTLGRGGSDITAVALAKTLKAKECEIYTDVDGVYTADPRIVRNAKKLARISYEEMLELASLGAQVMQARSMEVAKKFSVPLHIRSSFHNKRGTIISKEVKAMEEVLVSGVTVDKKEAKVTICDVPDKPGIAAKIFRDLANVGINVDMIIQNISRTGYTDMSFTVPMEELNKAVDKMDKIVKRVGAKGVIYNRDIAKVSVVGVGMKSHSGVAAKLFEALATEKVNIDMISTSEIKISCVINKKHAKKAVRAIHKAFKLGKK
ncbi:MAG: aspartate kinase, partial [Candidatus Omnitrophota bacterium]|nr:aspartate kinase [Candidatus Omnitrophota bacterium]